MTHLFMEPLMPSDEIGIIPGDAHIDFAVYAVPPKYVSHMILNPVKFRATARKRMVRPSYIIRVRPRL